MKYFFVLFLSLIGCSNYSSNKEAFFYDAPFAKDSAFKSILADHQKRVYDFIGLKQLDKGTDSFEIRISMGYGIIAGLDIFSIRKDSSGWSGRHIYFQDTKFKQDYLGEIRYETLNTEVDSFWIAKPFKPICGWIKFIDSLNYYSLYTIRDQSQIEGCKLGGLDGTTAIIELSTKNSYKYISHWISGNSTCNEFVRFKNFIEMMERQLGMDYCWPRCWVREK